MSDESPAPKYKINKTKIYASAIGIFLLANFAVETGVALLESSTHQSLYPIFPYTRIGLLIITILAANYYIRRRSGKPKPKMWWRFLKPVLVIIAMFGLAIGASLSVSQADVDRTNMEVEQALQKLDNLQVPTSQIPSNSFESDR